MSSWFRTPIARLFGIFNKEPALRDTKTQENTDDTIIKELANTADKARAAAQVPTATSAVAIAAINANLALDNALNEKPSDEANAENLIIENDTLRKEYDRLREESMQAFIAAQQNITNFRQECVEEAINQFQKALDDYGIQVKPQISRAIIGKIAGSWSELLISSTQDDTSVYLSMKTFFFRINQAIDALLTQCIFLSTKKWGVMQTALHALRGTTVHTPPPDFESYPKVQVGPCWYVVGPILDFQNIEGRIFIYVKCYSTAECTDGIYFWVYGSQSEGFNRVFFKLDPFGSIEKGFDYTQGTFVHLPLQMALCRYYQEHRIKTPQPRLLNTLSDLNLFMSLMPYLQQDSRTNGYHLYKIDYSFRFIIRKGFPLHLPNMNIDSDWLGVVKMMCNQNNVKCDTDTDGKKKIIETLSREWESQCKLYFPNDDTHQHYEFSRRRMEYGTTCPYIFCFTTCGLKQSCPMFKLFLSANSYKNTFWCQGFQNYTAMLSVDSNRKIFSPVLHVVMGALLLDCDMKLSTLRNIMLNIGIMSDARLMSPVYNSATKALMTIGSGKFGETDAITNMPGVPPSRFAPNQALKSIQAQLTSYESLGLQFTPGKHRMRNDASLDAIIKENVTKKIDMVKCLAYFYIHHKRHEPTHPFVAPFVAEVIRLLKFHPDDIRSNLQQKINTAFSEPTSPPEAQTNATGFINRSPEAAAAALFGYIYSTTKFEQELTDFAHLCLKKEWIMSMMDYAYNASPRVFNRENAIYNYLGEDGVFHEFVPPPAPPAAPPAAPPPYVFISSFDEVRKEDTSPTSPDKNQDGSTTEVNVTVVTFANIYRVDCGYHEAFADDSDVLKSILKSMSILYQISTTVVYTRENPSKILYAVTHRTPLLCLPDLPDALKYLIAKKIKELIEELIYSDKVSKIVGQLLLDKDQIIFNNKSHLATFLKNITEILSPPKKILQSSKLNENERISLTQIQQLLEQLIQLLQQEEATAEELLTSPYTLLTTYGRVTSYGALFAGKMMEYFFGGDNGYYQLPYFFRHFDKFLKVCHQYDSTVLMYLPDVSPYDLLVPHPSVQSLLDSIKTYFKDIVFDTTTSNDAYIQTKLNESRPHIQAIFEYLIKDFMVNSKDADDKLYMDSSPSPSPSTSPSTSPKNAPYLFGPLENSTDSDSTYQPSQPSQSSQSSVGSSMGKRVRSRSISPGRPLGKGGALSIKNHNPTYKKKTSKPSKKSRKYIKSKRMMKSKGSKVTKPKTYKRRATGGKRTSKPNKTMRRYRRVRK